MVVQISLSKKEKHIQLTTVKFKIWVYFLFFLSAINQALFLLRNVTSCL